MGGTHAPPHHRAHGLGESAIAGGCLATAVASVTAAGLLCVIGGATASAALNF